MSVKGTIGRTAGIGSLSFGQQLQLTAPGEFCKEVSVQAANAGTLTTRTGNTGGTITLSGITNPFNNGDLVDVYWTIAGVLSVQRRCTVSAVAGQSFTIATGAGANLPAAATSLQVSKGQSITAPITGNNATAFAIQGDYSGQFNFLSSAPAELWTPQLDTGVVYVWDNDNGVVNPLAGLTVATILMSHHDTALAHNMRVGFLLAQ